MTTLLTQPITEYAMKQNCHAFFEDLNSKDPYKISSWFEDHSTIWIPPAGPVKSRTKITVYFRAVFQKYKELNWYITEVFSIGENRCLVLSESKGVFKNDIPYKNYLVTEMQFDENDKLILLSDYFKDTSCFTTISKS